MAKKTSRPRILSVRVSEEEYKEAWFRASLQNLTLSDFLYLRIYETTKERRDK